MVLVPPADPTHRDRCGQRVRALGMLICVMPQKHAGAHVCAKGITWRRYQAADGITYERIDLPPTITAYDLFQPDTLDVISTSDGEVLANANFYRHCSSDLLLQAEVNSWNWDESRVRLTIERAAVWASLAISAASDTPPQRS